MFRYWSNAISILYKNRHIFRVKQAISYSMQSPSSRMVNMCATLKKISNLIFVYVVQYSLTVSNALKALKWFFLFFFSKKKKLNTFKPFCTFQQVAMWIMLKFPIFNNFSIIFSLYLDDDQKEIRPFHGNYFILIV